MCIRDSHGRALWEKLMAAGKPYDICPYGTETMHVLRAEKGYIIIGQDTDGTVTPEDAGIGWAIGKAKPDFVGKRSLARPDIVAKGRKQLVGLLTENPKTVLEMCIRDRSLVFPSFAEWSAAPFARADQRLTVPAACRVAAVRPPSPHRSS